MSHRKAEFKPNTDTEEDYGDVALSDKHDY